MGRKKWSEIRAKASPQALQAAEELLASYRLREMREARGLTQSDLAERLEISQVSVSRLEARSDVRISTLQSVIEAMGGALDVRARFPDGAEYRLQYGEGDATVERIDRSIPLPRASTVPSATTLQEIWARHFHVESPQDYDVKVTIQHGGQRPPERDRMAPEPVLPRVG